MDAEVFVLLFALCGFEQDTQTLLLGLDGGEVWQVLDEMFYISSLENGRNAGICLIRHKLVLQRNATVTGKRFGNFFQASLIKSNGARLKAERIRSRTLDAPA